MKCKNCDKKEAIKYSKYSTGKFCCRECARAYSTKEKRTEISKTVSKLLKGKGNKEVSKNCSGCKKIFIVKWPLRKQEFCSKKCVIEYKKEIFKKECPGCKSKFEVTKKRSKQIFCGKSCASKSNGRAGGLKSVQSQNRRSKNEIYFGELCRTKFKTVKFNEPIFNGWDADIIIEDLKLAILWNGKWHYEKITSKHSVKQVQNRDKIKIKEIEILGYKPYVIKDMGKENKKFVEEEFEKLILNFNI